MADSADTRSLSATDSPFPRGRARDWPAWVNGVLAAACLYFFLAAINVMGAGLKTLGKSTDWLEAMVAKGDANPLIALFGSVLVTAVVQSSSFTTSLIIALAATPGPDGQPILSMQTAVYAVMGANIGTSVTNIIVALGNVRIRRQFRRAFTAALVHDIFNWLTVAILFPLEWITSAITGTGMLAGWSHWMADLLGLSEMEKGESPIKVITSPVVNGIEGIVNGFVEAPHVAGMLVAAGGLAMLFFSLVFMVKNLRGAVLRRLEGLFRRVFFRNDGTAYAVGAVTTVMVQSSSITTSLIVPLAGAGVVKLKRVYPYTLGANLGTTVTGVIASTANPVAAAVSVAISHVSFNLIGTLIWYPLRGVPIGIARWYGRLAANSKRYAIMFLFGVFVIVPLIAIGITELVLIATESGGE